MSKIDPEKVDLRRSQKAKSTEPEEEKVSKVSDAVGKIIDLVGNPSREKIREVTSIDRVQGRLLPQLDIIDMMWRYLIEIASFRQDADEYEKVFKKKRPVPPSIIDEFTFRTAQWQKSVSAMNLKSLMDLALAETEARAGGEDYEYGGRDPWKDD